MSFSDVFSSSSLSCPVSVLALVVPLFLLSFALFYFLPARPLSRKAIVYPVRWKKWSLVQQAILHTKVSKDFSLSDRMAGRGLPYTNGTSVRRLPGTSAVLSFQLCSLANSLQVTDVPTITGYYFKIRLLAPNTELLLIKLLHATMLCSNATLA